MSHTAQAIAEQFPGDEWIDVRAAVEDAVGRGVSPTRIGFPSPLYGQIKGRLRIIADAMEADGLFPPPLFTMNELRWMQVRQDKLADLAEAQGVAPDAPLSPDLSDVITPASLRARVFPTLKLPIEAEWRRRGGKLSSGGFVVPAEKAKVARV